MHPLNNNQLPFITDFVMDGDLKGSAKYMTA